MKLHSGRVDCILGGGSAFWAGAFSESIYIHRNPLESKEILGNPWKSIEIHMNFRVYILCPGFKTNSVMKLHSGRVD